MPEEVSIELNNIDDGITLSELEDDEEIIKPQAGVLILPEGYEDIDFDRMDTKAIRKIAKINGIKQTIERSILIQLFRDLQNKKNIDIKYYKKEYQSDLKSFYQKTANRVAAIGLLIFLLFLAGGLTFKLYI